MADRFPLILNTSTNQIQEIPSGDNLDLTGVGINNVGVITSGNVQIGGGTTDLIVNGNARVTGILTVGTSSLILDGPNNLVNVGTALTLGHTQGVQFHTQNLHSAGFEVNQINVSGASTIGGNLDANGDLDVDGHTNLDNLSVAGVSTFTGNADFSAGVDVTGHATVSQSLTVTGTTSLGETLNITGNDPNITFVDSNNNPDFKIFGNGGTLNFVDSTSSANRLVINSDGHVDIPGNLDCGAGIDVTGNATVSGNLSVGGVLTYEDVTNVDSIGIITARNGINVSSGTATFQGAIDANGDLDVDGHTNLDNVSVAGVSTFTGNADFSAGIDVTGVIETTVAGADNMMKIKTTSSGDPILQFNAAGSGGHDIYYNRSTNELTFKSAGGSDRLKIAPHGDLLPAVDSQYNIGSSTVRFANIYADTLHGAGSNITALNGSNIASGTVPVARIGTGTKNSTTFYRGDGTFQVVNTDLVGDTSPQLGGDLSSNNFDIHISDNKSLEFGDTTSPDLYIKHSVGHNANFIVSYNGDIEHHMTSSKKIIKGFQNSGTPYVALYHDNTPKLLTEAGGINVKSPGSDWNNIERTSNGYYGFAFRKEDGSSFNGYLGFTGGGSEINNMSAAQDMVIRSETNIILSKGYSTRLLTTDSNGALSLYYGNGEKFKTTDYGATIDGRLRCYATPQSTSATTPIALTLSSYTNAAEEGPYMVFNSKWMNGYDDWVVGAIAGIYETQSPGGNNAGAIVFRTNYNNNGQQGLGGTEEKMRIRGDGQVRIKHSANTAEIEHAALRVQKTGTSYDDKTMISIENGDGTAGDLDYQTSHIDFSFFDTNTNVYPQVRISAHVGDGSNADSQVKEGKGWLSFHCSNTSATSGQSNPTEHFRIKHNGDLLGTDTSIGSLCDSRLKKDITDYSYSLDVFKQFKPKTFNWINPDLHGKHTNQRGFIAQEVESVDSYFTDQTIVDEKIDDYNLVSDGLAKTTKLVEKDAMYISVIQQMIDKIEKLETEVASLKGS